MSAEFEKLLPIFTEAGVEFILIGGVAGVVHGSARATYDVGVLYPRTKENMQRLADALAPHKPSWRDTPAELPFTWDVRTIRGGLNFTLTTKLGHVDFFAEVTGGETYSDLLPHSFEVEAFGVRLRCLDLPTLIRIKEAVGRPKDREAIAELRVLLEESQKKEI